MIPTILFGYMNKENKTHGDAAPVMKHNELRTPVESDPR